MESNSKETVVILLDQLIKLLSENDEDWWAHVMKSLMDNYINLIHSKTKQEAAAIINNSMLGGMGSFSDLTLYKNGKPLAVENQQLEFLRNEIFSECELVQYGRLSARIFDSFKNERPYTTYKTEEDSHPYYRIGSEKEPLGKFVVGVEVMQTLKAEFKENKMPLPIRPVINTFMLKKHRILSPKNTVARVAFIKREVTILTEKNAQIYLDKPWRLPGMQVTSEEMGK